MNIVVAAHYNLNNGDRALLAATLSILKTEYPNENIIISAYDPEKFVDNKYEVVRWALSNGIREKILLKLSYFRLFRIAFWNMCSIISDTGYVKAVKNADVVLISGGHHLTDFLSKSNYYRLAANFVLPIKYNKKIIMLPQTIGPAKSKEVRNSISKILSKVSSLAYRDDSSLKFLKSLDVKINMRYVPDLVYSLTNHSKSNVDFNIVGVALYHSYGKRNGDAILSFTISNLINVIDILLSKGFIVKVIQMDEGDEKVVDEIFSKLSSENKKQNFYLTGRNKDILEIIDEFSGLNFVIAYKTHATIFSMISKTPLIAVSYHSKTIEFMQRIGLADYVIKDNEASYEKICSLIDKVQENRSNILKLEEMGVEANRTLIRNYLMEMKRCF